MRERSTSTAPRISPNPTRRPLVAAAAPLDLLVVNHALSEDGALGNRGSVVLLTSGAHLAPTDRDCLRRLEGRARDRDETLAASLADRGIRVNCVNPGPTDTGWGIGDADPAERMPFGRWGEPDDAARLVAWLCSDDGRWLTGQVLDSEGGFRR